MLAISALSEANVYQVKGQIDFDNVKNVWQQGKEILSKSPAAVTFDFAEVNKSNSAGLLLLIGWLRDALQLNKQVQFRNVPQPLLRAARVSDLQTILPLR